MESFVNEHLRHLFSNDITDDTVYKSFETGVEGIKLTKCDKCKVPTIIHNRKCSRLIGDAESSKASKFLTKDRRVEK